MPVIVVSIVTNIRYFSRRATGWNFLLLLSLNRAKLGFRESEKEMFMPQELTEEATSRSVQTKDWKIHYHEAGDGYPIVMLHGSGPGATGWSNFGPNMKGLADRFRVIAPDMPGWGASDAVATERDHAGAAIQLLDALGIEKAAFVGNSMGGMTSISVAAWYPDRISQLITMGSPAPGPSLFHPGDGPSEGLKVLLQGYRDPSPESMRQLVEIMTYDPAFVTDELIRQRSDAARKRPDHLANFLSLAMRGMGRFVTVDEVARIQTPTLLFHGRDDRVVPYEHSLRLVSLIADSRLVVVNRCGHWLQLEHAEEFNRMVADFVSA